MLTFSLATEADIAELNGLVNRAYRGEASLQGWTTEAHLLEGQRTDPAALREMLHESEAVFLLARTTPDGVLVGSVYLQAQGPDLYLGMLSVEPRRQDAGIGKQLLRAAEERARQLGCPAVRMTVLSARPELLAWYERHGYGRTGEVVPFPTDPRHGQPTQPLVLLVLRKPVTAEL